MNANKLVIVFISFVTTAAAMGTALASLRPAAALAADVYVRRTEATPPTSTCPLIFAGNFPVSPTSTGADLVVTVTDLRTPQFLDLRKGRTSQDNVIKVASGTVVTSLVIVTGLCIP
jgi:hypothetical protein